MALLLHAHATGHGDDHAHATTTRTTSVVCPAGPPQPTVREHFHAEIVAASAVRPQDRLLVRPGERVPVDGLIVEGESSLNEAAVTGESLPVRAAPATRCSPARSTAKVRFEIVATRVAGDSTIARIARLVEQAQAQRSPQERFIDRFARDLHARGRRARPAGGDGAGAGLRATTARLAGRVIWLAVSRPRAADRGLPLRAGDQHPGHGRQRADTARAARRAGQGRAPLDRLADARRGFRQDRHVDAGPPRGHCGPGRDCRHAEAVAADCDDCTDVIALAASVELRSGHPIAHAIAQAANARGVMHRYAGAIGIHAIAGRGVVGDRRRAYRDRLGRDVRLRHAAD